MESSPLKREPVVIVFSILAGLQVLSAGLGMADTLDKDTTAIIVLLIAVIQAGATFYVRGMVAPWDSVVTQLTTSGDVISGPAAAPGAAGPAGGIAGPKNPPMD